MNPQLPAGKAGRLMLLGGAAVVAALVVRWVMRSLAPQHAPGHGGLPQPITPERIDLIRSLAGLPEGDRDAIARIVAGHEHEPDEAECPCVAEADGDGTRERVEAIHELVVWALALSAYHARIMQTPQFNSGDREAVTLVLRCHTGQQEPRHGAVDGCICAVRDGESDPDPVRQRADDIREHALALLDAFLRVQEPLSLPDLTARPTLP